MPVQKKYFFFILFFLASNLYSQEKVAEYYLPPSLFKGGIPSLFCGGDKQVIADLHTNDAGVRLLINEGAGPETLYQYGSGVDSLAPKYIASTNGIKEIRSLQWLCGVSQSNVFDDCYFRAGSRVVFFVETDIVSGTTVITDTVPLDNNEHIITVLEDSGKLYLISFLDKSDKLYIRVKQPAKKLRGFEKTIPVSAGKEYRGREPHFSDFFRDRNESGLFIYDNTHPYPSNMQVSPEKIYHIPGKLVFSLENRNQQTNIVSLQLSDLEHEFYVVPPPFRQGKFVDREEDATSSFLANDILFKSGTYGGYFYIAATNIYSGTVHCNYIVKLSEEDKVYNSPFFKTGQYNGLAEQNKEDLYKYLEKPSIGINYAGGSLFDIEISTLYTKSTWASVLLSLAGSFAGTYAINSIPRARGFSLFFFYQQKKLLVKNKLDISTGGFVASPASSFSTDKWENKLLQAQLFSEKNKGYNPGTLIEGEAIYIYFIDEDEGKFYVYKF